MSSLDWSAVGWVALGSILTVNVVLAALVLAASRFAWRVIGGHAVRVVGDAGKRALDARLGPPGYQPTPRDNTYPAHDEWAGVDHDDGVAFELRPPRNPTGVGPTPRPRDEEPLA